VSAHADDSPSPAVDRLTSIGLPPRSAGWVPEQAGVSPPLPVEQVAPTTPHRHALPSRFELARLSFAEWLPAGLGDRVRAMSSSGFAMTIGAVVAVAVAGGVYLHDRHHSSSYSDSFSSYGPSDSASSTPDPSATYAGDGSSIVIDVGGAVRHPGLVTLPVGARVADAITAAGGPLRPGELARTNLAARVTDGELLLIGQKSRHGGDTTASGGLISLNTASLAKLETLPGVGPVTAQKIVDWRNAHGGFTSVEQLQQVSGIGPTRYAELSPLVAP
jgi:competence protein ComEA